MSSDGIVLSHPPSSTTPSIGLARNSSSADIAARFRQSIAVGRTWVSPRPMTGMWSGHAARFPDPVRDAPGQVAQMAVARDQVRTGVGDGDVRPAVERVIGQAAPHPAAMDVAVPIRAGVPVLTATLAHATSAHR